MGALMSFSGCATSHCCLFDFLPSSLVFESQGGSVSYPCWEKKGDLVYLKEHAGLRGLFPQRGGYESECHSDSAHCHTTSVSACCQGSPALTSSRPPPLPSSSPRYPLPDRRDRLITLPSFFPCWLHRCPAGNGELRGSEDGCYSNHTSDAARVQ